MIYVTAFDGMGSGEDSLSGALQNLAGIETSDIMHIANDFLNQEGVTSLTDGDFEATAAGTDMNVDVATGVAYVENDDWAKATSVTRFWRVESDAIEEVTLDAADPSLDRIDLIILQINDAAVADDEASNVSTVTSVTGTPDASPVAPTLPDHALLLAEVAVSAGVTTISDSDITDSRQEVSLSGGDILPSEGEVLNGKIDVQFSSGNLTVSVLTEAGVDPSPTDPLKVKINGVQYEVTSTLAVTKNGGTNWCKSGDATTATKNVNLFPYLGVNAGNVFIGFSRIPSANVYGDLSATTTSDRHFATSASPSASDPIAVIGRFRAVMSASASFAWSAPSTQLIIQRAIRDSELLDYTPAFSASGSMTVTLAPTVRFAKYQIQGNQTFMFIYVDTFTLGGTASTQVLSTLPIAPGAIVSSFNIHSGAFVVDAGGTPTAQSGQCFVNSTSWVFGRYDNANWTLAAGKSCRAIINFPLLP
jgi:hypothetical protein